jgi:hypothetical protein
MKIRSRCSTRLDASPEAVYGHLTNYDGYADWMPGVASARLLAQEGDLAVAEFELVPGGARQSVECIHDRNAQVLVRPIGSATALGQLQWTLSRAPEGGTDLELVISSRLGWHLLRPGVWRGRSAARVVDALRGYLSGPEGIAFVAGSGDTVVELLETPDGMVLWLNGKRYRVVADAEE